jgi:hypothetical protein
MAANASKNMVAGKLSHRWNSLSGRMKNDNAGLSE